ncbi:MAG: DUF86 domain-containing protein [Thermoactinomycetaceae bacterium]|nr:DUF86 domain-containing protein [Thermoactinomycetaceae bacterium]
MFGDTDRCGMEGSIVVYDVDTDRIERQLRVLRDCVAVLEETKRRRGEQEGDPVLFFAASRALHLASECIIDVGTTMIDGFIMRDPGGYLDIVDILEDERVIPKEGADRIRDLVRFRDRLVRRYDELSPGELEKYWEQAEVLLSFEGWVRDYLRQNLF